MIELLASTLRLSTPLLFAAMGGLICERAGIATICLEGVMLVAAWTAAVVTHQSHNPWLAAGAGVIAGGVAMALHAFLVVKAKGDQIISGVVVNFLAMGLTPLLSHAFFGSPTNTPSIPLAERMGPWSIPLLDQIPGLGYLLFSQPGLVYIALILPFALHWGLYRSVPGLRVLASGDGPEALRTSGVSPERVRYWALLVGGAVTGLGGIYLSICHASQFTREMTAGRGFIALTAVIFGKWRPIPTAAACLLFGLTDALQIQLQSASMGGFAVPVQFIQALPYVVTLIVLAGFIGNARAPLSLGQRL